MIATEHQGLDVQPEVLREPASERQVEIEIESKTVSFSNVYSHGQSEIFTDITDLPRK
jgi:hypothetical protein